MIHQPAPAKINLTLEVVGRREDARHLLDSVVVFADVGDAIVAAPAAEDRVTLSGDFADALRHMVADGEGALSVTQARDALRAHLERVDPVSLALDKALPVASGIGGGSSDAAATLRALARLWETGLDRAALAALGAALGADVPVCVHAAPARMRGAGERVDALARWPAFDAVLVHPGVPAPTPAVFAAYAASGAAFTPERAPPATGDHDEALAWLAGGANGLEAAARSIAPEIGDALAALGRAQGCELARMSGSGATCFALFPDPETAASAARAIAADHPAWWVRAARLNGVGEGV